MNRLALALSPHLDDAVFSAGGTLAGLALADWRVVIATAFTASVPDPRGFALACQLDKGFAPDLDYMALRREEDAVACAALGAEPRWLPLREAPHRGYGSAAELFGPVRQEDAIPLRPALAALIAELAPGLLLAPQAIGGHVDHVLLVSALDDIAPAIPRLWWRDFPYVARETAPTQPFADRMTALPERAILIGGDAAARKRAACLAYASQIGFQFGGWGGLDSRLAATQGRERFRVTGAVPADLGGGMGEVA